VTAPPESPEPTAPALPRRLAIVGLGLMGGSLGLALRAAEPAARIAGMDADPAAARQALARGAVTELIGDAASLPAGTEMVALAVPPGAVSALLPRIEPRLPEGALLMDLSSVMLPGTHARRVPTHPLAGSEASGIEAARADLYAGRTVLIGAPIDPGSPGGRAAAFWSALGARPVAIVPALHDALVALTSHLPYAASVALVRTLRRTGSMTRALADTAGPGLKDTIRVAGSPSALWAEILTLNGPKLIPALELLEREVRALRQAIAAGGPALREHLEDARSFREELSR
jgi:cyclohexadieny/prephenate dehydrogenase